MNTAELVKYIDSVEISDVPAYMSRSLPLRAANGGAGLEDPDLLKASAVVSGGAVIVFADGVSIQHREDALNCMLFAELVANKQFDRESQQEQWFKLYDNVVLDSGWAGAGMNSQKYESLDQSFSMDKVGLELIAAAVAAMAVPGPTAAMLVKVTTDALIKLKSEERALRIFERHARKKSGADFRVATVMEAGGIAYMALGAVSFSASVNVVNVLFWEYNSASVKIYQGSSLRILNETTHSVVRESLAQRLQVHAINSIAAYEI